MMESAVLLLHMNFNYSNDVEVLVEMSVLVSPELKHVCYNMHACMCVCLFAATEK